jgi:uncharacterized protein YneF (UPF0154 family)
MTLWKQFIDTFPEPGLLIARPRVEVVPHLEQLASQLFLLGGPIIDLQAANACLSGLWLRFDHFERSHEISQSLQTSDGSFWHGIAHRREGDFENACYWFRRMGENPAEAAIRSKIDSMALTEEEPPYSAANFTRMVQKGANKPSLLKIQEIEWQMLFEDCRKRALGTSPD